MCSLCSAVDYLILYGTELSLCNKTNIPEAANQAQSLQQHTQLPNNLLFRTPIDIAGLNAVPFCRAPNHYEVLAPRIRKNYMIFCIFKAELQGKKKKILPRSGTAPPLKALTAS